MGEEPGGGEIATFARLIAMATAFMPSTRLRGGSAFTNGLLALSMASTSVRFPPEAAPGSWVAVPRGSTSRAGHDPWRRASSQYSPACLAVMGGQ